MIVCEQIRRPLVDEDQPKIDVSKIRFPSDNLTIGMIRKLHPNQLDGDFEADGLFTSEEYGTPAHLIGEMLFSERVVAEGAYRLATGQKCSSSYMDDLKGYTEDVQNHYIHYGLADGHQTAKILVESIESQAQDQAKIIRI